MSRNPIKIIISDQTVGAQTEPTISFHHLGAKHSIELSFPGVVVERRGDTETRRPMTQEEIDLIVERTGITSRTFKLAFELPLGRTVALVDETVLEEYDAAKRSEMLTRLFLQDLMEHVELPVHLAVLANTLLGGAAKEAA